MGEESTVNTFEARCYYDCFWHDWTTSAGAILTLVFKSLYCLSPGQVTGLCGTLSVGAVRLVYHMQVWTCMEPGKRMEEMEALTWLVQYNAVITEMKGTEIFQEIGTEVTKKNKNNPWSYVIRQGYPPRNQNPFFSAVSLKSMELLIGSLVSTDVFSVLEWSFWLHQVKMLILLAQTALFLFRQ